MPITDVINEAASEYEIFSCWLPTSRQCAIATPFTTCPKS